MSAPRRWSGLLPAATEPAVSEKRACPSPARGTAFASLALEKRTHRMDDALFAHNLEALESLSPEAAARVRAADVSGIVPATAASGAVILEDEGRALDSRRDPVAAAERLAGSVTADHVVLIGFGSGYVAEALLRRGVHVAAVIDAAPRTLAAAMRARDLSPVLRAAPIAFLEDLGKPVAQAALRRRAEVAVGHPASVQSSPELRELLQKWTSIRVSGRRPRVLVVGPIYGGSLEIARSSQAACRSCGAEVRFLDFSAFSDGRTMFDGLPLPKAARNGLAGSLVTLLGDAVVQVASEWRADLVFALAQAPLGAAALDTLRERGISTAMWFVENVRVLSYWREVAAHYDWFYSIQVGRPLAQLAEAGAREVRYLPLACDPARHQPFELTEEERARFGADVSFAGSPYLNRLRLFSALADVPLRLWGPGWAVDPFTSQAAEGGRGFSLEEMVRIFCATRVNLNLHAATHVQGIDPDPDYVNPRTFELAACEAFQLVDRRDPLPALFADDEVTTFSSLSELRELITYYLEHDEERRATAARARKRALADHTYVHRLRAVLDEALPPELAAAASDGDAIGRETLEQALVRLSGAPVLSPEEAMTRAVYEIQAIGQARL